MQSKVAPASCASAVAARRRPRRSRRRRLPSRWRMLSRCRASSSTTSTRRSVCENLRLELPDRVDQLLALDRLERVADRAALERLVRVVVDRDDVHRDVARARVALEPVEHAEARMVGQVDVEQDGARLEPGRHRQALRGGVRDARSGSRARGRGRAGSRRSATSSSITRMRARPGLEPLAVVARRPAARHRRLGAPRPGGWPGGRRGLAGAAGAGASLAAGAGA